MMKPKICILESIHASGEAILRTFADVAVHTGLSTTDIGKMIGDYDVVIVKSVTAVNRQLIDMASQLKVIARAGTGTDNIDLEYAYQKGIKVVTVPAGNSISAAEFAIGFILMLCRRMPEALARMQQQDYRRHLLEGRELSQMKVGIVGLGRVGTAVAKRLQAFECKLMGYDPGLTQAEQARVEQLGCQVLNDLPALIKQVDVLTLHCPLTVDSERMINAELLAYAKEGLFLINTARGKLIDDQALLAALDSGRLAAAALDVIYPEPPYNAPPGGADYDHQLLHHAKVMVTPHMAASTSDAQQKIALLLAEELKSFFINSEVVVN